ncbi:MAG: hypothetical protein LVQ63_04200 [Thermoplasmatales archaeon]|nr:hypothetical protein [Thermoplasmatales archaeon]
MDIRKRRMVQLTTIFVALETAFMYYVIGLFYLSRIPGTPFQYFRGLGYVSKPSSLFTGMSTIRTFPVTI